LSPADSRHALRSLRLHPGDPVTVADGRGGLARARLSSERDGLATIEVGEVDRVRRPRPRVTVALAPPKGNRLSWAIQKLAEIGVDQASLVRTERGVRQWPSGEADRTERRLRSIAREAAMQSRRAFIMDVVTDRSFDEAVTPSGGPVVLLMQEAAGRLHDVMAEDVISIGLVVGPEGGWTPHEVESARGLGAIPASMGEGVLRTETAAVVAGTMVLARYGRLG
jgi:16S rRNA (uracil1498-N3)-methyltransferase